MLGDYLHKRPDTSRIITITDLKMTKRSLCVAPGLSLVMGIVLLEQAGTRVPTGTEISVENSPESKLVFAWCSENGLPMMSEHELDVWRHKGARLFVS